MKELIEYLEQQLAYAKGTGAGVSVISNKQLELCIDALKQADHYKGHDLRKDPNDLPKEHMVLACIRGIGGHEYHDIIYYGKPLGVHPKPKGKVFYQCDSEWGDYVIDDVVTWAYFPKFESEEKE